MNIKTVDLVTNRKEENEISNVENKINFAEEYLKSALYSRLKDDLSQIPQSVHFFFYYFNFYLLIYFWKIESNKKIGKIRVTTLVANLCFN